MLELNKDVCKLLHRLKNESRETYEHSVNVAIYSMMFGIMLELSTPELDILGTAAILHDVGKLNVPEEILHKKTPLTDAERALIREHPTYSVSLLKRAGFNNEKILEIIKSHHERPDGTGYPERLKNDEIPFLTRILSICDSYDAMKSKRAYKNSYDLEFIRNEFIKCSGTQFDKDLTAIFIKLIDKEIEENRTVKPDWVKAQKKQGIIVDDRRYAV